MNVTLSSIRPTPLAKPESFAQPSPPRRVSPELPSDKVSLSSANVESARPQSNSSYLSDGLKAALGLCLVGAGLAAGGVAASRFEVVQTAPRRETESTRVTQIAPQDTDPAIRQARGPHQAVVDPSATPNGYLLVSVGGTNSIPSDFLPFDKLAAREGYSVLGLDYPNTVITTACKTSDQPDPCTLFRREIVAGEQVSDLVEVDRNNSIEHRLEALLQYQARNDPEHYARFIDENGPVWSKIVVAGHSQGSGHAGFLAKKFPTQAAILLAGPQDTTPAGPASWMSTDGQTDPKKFLSFLHQDDFFDSRSQLAAVRILRQEPDASATLVDHQSPDGPIVMTDAKVRDAHMSVMSPEFEDIWRGLLQKAIR